jgi:hypothetical protein
MESINNNRLVYSNIQNIIFKHNFTYLSLKSLFYNVIGINYTINNLYMNNLVLQINKLKYIWLNITSELNESLLEDYLNQTKICIQNIETLIYFIKEENQQNLSTISYSPTSTSLLNIKENNQTGIEWFNELISKYIFYGGMFPTTTNQFILFFKNNWNKISNSDTLNLTPIFLNYLGGISIEYNSYCLRDWLIKNSDVVKNKKNWIL